MHKLHAAAATLWTVRHRQSGAGFCCTRSTRVGTPREVGEGHVKLELVQDSRAAQAIGFRMAERLREMDHAQTAIDIAFQLQENYWNGRVELQCAWSIFVPPNEHHRGEMAQPHHRGAARTKDTPDH